MRKFATFAFLSTLAAVLMTFSAGHTRRSDLTKSQVGSDSAVRGLTEQDCSRAFNTRCHRWLDPE